MRGASLQRIWQLLFRHRRCRPHRTFAPAPPRTLPEFGSIPVGAEVVVY